MTANPKTYTYGARPTVTMTFTDENGDLRSPGTVVLKVKPPTGSVATYNDAAEQSPGVWTKKLPACNAAGRWTYRVEGSGGLDAVRERSFYVEASEVV